MKAITKLKIEIKRMESALNRSPCKSRWLVGYVDGLKEALKYMEGESDDSKVLLHKEG